MRAITLHGYDVGAEPLPDGGSLLTMIAKDRSELIQVALPADVARVISRALAGGGVVTAPAGALRDLKVMDG